MSATLLRNTRYHSKEKRGNKASVLSSFSRPLKTFQGSKTIFFDDIGELSPLEGNMKERKSLFLRMTFPGIMFNAKGISLA